MARDRDGWEYVDGAPRWAPTVSLQISEILGGLYGHEYDERRAELEDLVRAVYRDAAEKIRDMDLKEVDGFEYTYAYRLGWEESRTAASDLIFPNYPEESDSE